MFNPLPPEYSKRIQSTCNVIFSLYCPQAYTEDTNYFDLLVDPVASAPCCFGLLCFSVQDGIDTCPSVGGDYFLSC